MKISVAGQRSNNEDYLLRKLREITQMCTYCGGGGGNDMKLKKTKLLWVERVIYGAFARDHKSIE